MPNPPNYLHTTTTVHQVLVKRVKVLPVATNKLKFTANKNIEKEAYYVDFLTNASIKHDVEGSKLRRTFCRRQ